MVLRRTKGLWPTAAIGWLCSLPLPIAAGAEQADGPQDRLRVGEVNPEWFRDAEKFPAWRGEQEHKLAQAYPGRILRYGNLLALKLDNGKFVWLVDMHGHPQFGWFGCCEVYRLEDFWSGQNDYVVDVSFDEYSRTWLISGAAAGVTILVGTPHRDPSTPGLVVSVLASDMSGYQAEVWERDANAWKRTYHCDQLAYTTDFIRWEGPGEVLLGGPDRTGQVHQFILARSDGQWRTDACEENTAGGRP